MGQMRSLKMKNEFKIVFILFIHLYGCVECGVPKLNVLEEWVFDVQLNETNQSVKPLNITCTGDRELHWSTEVNSDYYIVESNRTGNTFYSTLTIEEPYPEDSGFINCSYNADGSGQHASTYVYLFDNKTGFVVNPGSHTPIMVEIGDLIELDCRTTHPNITVTVLKNSIEDVTKKFHDYRHRFSKTATSLQEQGYYACKIGMLNLEKTFLLTIKPRKTLQSPSIEKHRNSHYIVGDPFSLNCSIPVERKDNPSIRWELPNPDAKKIISRLNITGSAISKLEIFSPTLRDSGNYICIGTEGDSTVSDSMVIEVKERIEPFVAFDSRNDTKVPVLFVKEGADFQWILYFRGYPRDLKYTFFDPFGKDLKRKKKVETSLVYEDGKLELNMGQVMAEEFGNYSVRLEAPNKSYDESLVILVVNATPKISFGSPPQLYQVGKETNITAKILAFTLNITHYLPNVSWWIHTDCPDGIGSCDLENRTLLNSTVVKGKGPVNRFESTATFRPSSSGLLVCKVQNDLGVNSTQMYLKVSDKPLPFLLSIWTEKGVRNLTRSKSPGSIARSNVTIVEGDKLRVECFSLDFLYDSLELDTSESVSCDTRLSSGRCFTVPNMSMQDERSYTCAAHNILTGMEDKIPFHVLVIEKLAPVLLASSNVSEEGILISVKSSESFSIACYVDGRPAPTITWFKDGENIEDIPNFVDNKERVFLKEEKQVLQFKFAQKDYEGTYECVVENRVGSIQPFATVAVAGAALSSVEQGVIGVVVSAMIILMLVVVFLLYRVRKEKELRMKIREAQLYLFEKGNVGDLNKECTIDEQAELLPYDRAYEVERERIKLGKLLGVGAFGRVMQAEVRSLEEGHPTNRVAVKMCKDVADVAHLRALTLELKIMIYLGKHLNIVNLIGAYTGGMDKGELWILVEYCRYGNLLKFLQRAKTQFINQIDPITGEIDVYRMSSITNDPTSPTSLGRSSAGFGRGPNVDHDGYLQASHHGSIRSDRYIGRHPSATSRSDSTSGASRPGLYVGNPHYTTVGHFQEPSSPTSPSPPAGAEHYVMATQLPPVNSSTRKESSASNPSSELGYHLTINTEMTILSSPPPFSPTSSTSGDIFFDSQGKPISNSVGIPGISAPFSTTDLICWAWQVANGMDYLTRRKVLHGDLAARNLLLAEKNVVKISDFGLSRDMYKNDVYMKKGDEIMPIKWMAPEAIQQKVFSIQSDVWAFGITLWEMFTLGNTPYPGIPLNQDFTIALENGMVMEKPKYCNDEMYNLMMACWRLNPNERPSFSKIADMLSEMLSPESRKNYVEMNTFYAKKNEEWMGTNEDYLNMVSSPDFQNLYGPMKDEGIGMDQPYIQMRVIEDPSVGEHGRTGYLDMSTVRGNSTDPDSIFSPRAPSPNENGTVFSFTGDESALSEDQQSPIETSSLLDRTDGSAVRTQNDQNSVRNHNNNNLGIIMQERQQPLYQNLDKVALTNNHATIDSSVTDVFGDPSTNKVNYVNIMAV